MGIRKVIREIKQTKIPTAAQERKAQAWSRANPRKKGR